MAFSAFLQGVAAYCLLLTTPTWPSPLSSRWSGDTLCTDCHTTTTYYLLLTTYLERRVAPRSSASDRLPRPGPRPQLPAQAARALVAGYHPSRSAAVAGCHSSRAAAVAGYYPSLPAAVADYRPSLPAAVAGYHPSLSAAGRRSRRTHSPWALEATAPG